LRKKQQASIYLIKNAGIKKALIPEVSKPLSIIKINT